MNATLQESLDTLDLITLKEAATEVECGESRLRQAVANGEIEIGHIGRWVLVRRTQLLAWDEARRSRVLDGRRPEIKEKLRAMVQEADLSVLDARRREAVERRFGINGYVVHTLEQVGVALDVSRERARQIISGAVRGLALKQETA